MAWRGDRVEVEVCVCGAGQQHVDFLLHRLATGDMLGAAQAVRLTLWDQTEVLKDVEDVAQDVKDACYPLVKRVQVATSLQRCASLADVIVLWLPSTSKGDHQGKAAVLQSYASALNSASGLWHKAVVVAGVGASAAAGVVMALVPRLSQHLVIAVDIKPGVSHNQGGGAYHQVSVMCEGVRSWWTGVQETGPLVLGVGFHSIPSMPCSCVLPMPVSITSPLTATIRTDVPLEGELITATVRDFLQYLNTLGMTETEVALSHLHSHL